MPRLHSWHEPRVQSKRPCLKQIKSKVLIRKKYKCKRLANTIYTATQSPGVVTCGMLCLVLPLGECKEKKHNMAGGIPWQLCSLLEPSFPFYPGLTNVLDEEESPPANPTQLNLKIFHDAYRLCQQP